MPMNRPAGSCRSSRDAAVACTSGLAAAVSIALLGAGASLAEAAGPPSAHRGDMLRMAAGDLALLGRAQAEPSILAAALALLLMSGAGTEAGDPWGGDLLLAEARALARGDPAAGAALDRLAAQRRGVVDGISRGDLRLAPGETRTIRLLVAGGEPASVEAWLRRGSEGADIDLTVTTPDGAGGAGTGAEGVVELASDRGPRTGVPGFRAFAEWVPERCGAVEVTLVNRGSAPAAVVFLAPPAGRSDCGG
jgi:hypothetical protein